jgi:flagellar protein FliS
MNDQSAASAYQQSSARSASPVGVIVALYDTLLRDFRRALAAQSAGQIEARVYELNHALTVIAHLREALDHQRGGDAAPRFSRLYDVTHSLILEANVSGSRPAILKLIDMYTGLRQAWDQADKQLGSAPDNSFPRGVNSVAGPAAPAPQPPAPKIAQPSEPRHPRAAKPAPAAPASTNDSPRGRWSA